MEDNVWQCRMGSLPLCLRCVIAVVAVRGFEVLGFLCLRRCLLLPVMAAAAMEHSGLPRVLSAVKGTGDMVSSLAML